MLKKFDEYLRDKGIQVESFIPDTPKNTHTSDGKDVAGLKEVIEVEDLGKMKVKLDSGNTAMNALIVQDYYEDKDEGTVKFDFNGEEKKFDVVKHIRIWHHGKSTERPVIKVNIKFNGKTYEDELIDLKISDLTGTKNYRCRMLLCKDFMKKANVVIDPSKEFKLTDKKELPKKKKKKKVNESVWSDLQDRSSGEVERKEDIIVLENTETIEELYEYLKRYYVLLGDKDIEVERGQFNGKSWTWLGIPLTLDGDIGETELDNGDRTKVFSFDIPEKLEKYLEPDTYDDIDSLNDEFIRVFGIDNMTNVEIVTVLDGLLKNLPNPAMKKKESE